MNTIRIFVFIILYFTSCLSFAATSNSIEIVTVSASAETEERAIAKALAQAIQQTNGVQINVKASFEESPRGFTMDWMGNKTVIEGQEINKGFTSLQASGPIKSYKVTSSKFLSDKKTWQVTLKAEILKYANIGEDRSQLLQLVVLPFRTEKDTFSTITGATTAENIALTINQLMTNTIVQSGRFRILDRSFWAESNIEELIVKERSSATHESIKLGQKLGADYILAGSIKNFDIKQSTQNLYGSSTPIFEASFDLQIRIIEVATSDIIWTSNIRQFFDNQTLNAKLKDLRAINSTKTTDQAAVDLQDDLYNTMSTKISQQLIMHFYPVKVLDIKGENAIYLTQGNQQLILGSQYTIYSNPSKVKDPDTGLTIAIDGAALATVEVTDIKDKYATAKLVDGNFKAITVGAITRPNTITTANPRPSAKEAKPLTPGSSEKPLSW